MQFVNVKAGGTCNYRSAAGGDIWGCYTVGNNFSLICCYNCCGVED